MKYRKVIGIVTEFEAHLKGTPAAALSKNTLYPIVDTYWHLKKSVRLRLLQFLRGQLLLLTKFLVHQQEVCIKNNQTLVI